VRYGFRRLGAGTEGGVVNDNNAPPMNANGGPPSVVDRLRKLDACAVSDALDALGIAAASLGLRAVWPVDRVVAGRVRTILAGARASDAPADHIAAAAIDTSGSEHVLVIANRGRMDVSCWGGILTRAAVARSIAGVVVDGACRDVSECESLDFPVFARAVVPVSARGRIVQLAMDEVIEFDGVQVAPDDFIVADRSGVVFIPQGRAEEVLVLAEQIAAIETQMAMAVDGGVAVSQVMHDSQFPTVEAQSP
jgi:regulator of RNase E activity RraA